MGISGFAPVIFRKDKVKTPFDERDLWIQKRAVFIGFVASFLAMGLCCMIPSYVLDRHVSISVIWLPLIWMAAFAIQCIAYAVAILIQYGREGKHADLQEGQE
jgi:hypothetical protein